MEGKVRLAVAAGKSGLVDAARVSVCSKTFVSLVADLASSSSSGGAGGGGGGGGGGIASGIASSSGSSSGSNSPARLCYLEHTDGHDGEPTRFEAILSQPGEKDISPNIILVARPLQEACGFKLGDKLRLTLTNKEIPPLFEIVVRQFDEVAGVAVAMDPDDAHHWEFALESCLERAKYLTSGLVMSNVQIGQLKKSFKIVSVNSKQFTMARCDSAKKKVKIQLSDDDLVSTPERPELRLENVPGFSAQVTAINDFLFGFSNSFMLGHPDQSCALVIHGVKGTGKTRLLDAIADTGWGRVFRITQIEPSKSTAIREVFKQAREQRPSIILIDDIHELLSPEKSNHAILVNALGNELDALGEEAMQLGRLANVLVVGACRDYLTQIPAKLQEHPRFEENILLPIPTISERLQILEAMNPKFAEGTRPDILEAIAKQAHAFTPADIQRLERRAARCLRKRYYSAPVDERPSPMLMEKDFKEALRTTRPSVMHDISLKPPTVRWQDIGGQESLKQTLQQMIKFTTSTDNNLRQVIGESSKGILLYGPPGCSKTLSAQAMATEAGFNFFSVKGPELLNMYVGESERAIRQLFARARSASPSIIFFDEIETMGGTRGGPGSGGIGRSATSGPNTITTLLTEMDGFETLSGVLILAATNQPDAIDPALLRPGRFNDVVYVGPPDQTARECVFRVHLGSKKLSPDVDIEELARRAEGHSGAEIKRVCELAGKAVAVRMTSNEANLKEGTEGDLGKPRGWEFTQADFIEALDKTPRLITPTMISDYQRWEGQFHARKY